MYNNFFEGLEKDYGMSKKEFENAEFHYCGNNQICPKTGKIETTLRLFFMMITKSVKI